MTITALPPAPSRADAPEDFISKANVFVAALATLVTEMNAALGVVNITEWVTGTTYAIGNVVWSPADFQAYRRKTAGAGTTDPSADSTNWQRTEVSLTTLQTQSATAFTTAGTAPAYTLTPSPAIAAYTANQRFRVKFAADGTTGSNTLNISALGVKNLKQYDSTGTKVAAVVKANLLADVEYDGTDLVVLDALPPLASPPVRQTVLSGPVDANGQSAFVGATGGTTVTATATLKSTAAAGGDADYIGSIVNPAWTGLSTNGTMYLYLDITSAGVITTGSTTLKPTYQWGGTYSTTNGQHTFNIEEMTMKVGNGSVASQVTRVFVGEVTVAGSVVTAITWYALMGRYQGEMTFTTNAKNSVTHNLGVQPAFGASRACLRFTSTQSNYAVDDEIPIEAVTSSGNLTYASSRFDRLTASAGVSTAAPYIQNANTLAYEALTTTNVKLKFYVNRGW